MKQGRAQAIIEYALLIALVIAALTAMHTYIKRGIQAGIKVTADGLGGQADEFDPEKGEVSESEIHSVSSGKPVGAFEVPALAEGEAQRIRLSAGGGVRRDTYIMSEVKPLRQVDNCDNSTTPCSCEGGECWEYSYSIYSAESDK
jgi:hypothetical protein